MFYDVLYESCPWHTRAALFDETGRLVSIRVDDPSRQFIEGAVIWGRVRKVNKSLDAAFIDIGDIEDGFLPLKTLPKGVKLTEGQGVVVRVTRGKSMGKGARLHGRVLQKDPEPGVDAPTVLQEAPRALTRSLMDAGDHPVRVWVLDDRFVEEISDRVHEKQIFRVDENEELNFKEMLDIQLDSLTGDTFAVPNGGYLTIEQTKALVAIDIDSAGAERMGKDSLRSQVNKFSCEEIARLCVLMDLGGTIIIDFITPPNKKESEKLFNHLKQSFASKDDHKVELRSISRFGIAEINRERKGETIPVLLARPVYVAGRILLEIMRQRNGQGEIVIEAAPLVADLLKDRLTTNVALATYGRPVRIEAQTEFAVTTYKIGQAKTV